MLVGLNAFLMASIADDSDQEVDDEEQKKRLQYVASIKESRVGFNQV